MLDAKPIEQLMRAPTPARTEHVAPSPDIHTIATGHMLDHVRSGSCWCHPTSVDDGGRSIWTHYGENFETYPQWQTHPETGQILTDADGEMLPTKRAICKCCGAEMPQGRHHVNADCLACVSKPAKG